MDWRMFATVFGSILVAEIADKTQIATLLFASNAPQNRWLVFLAAAGALVAASALAVSAGTLLGQWIDQKLMARLAGVGFIAVGVWTLVRSAA
jgi:putative Ca2+/H+ antiporter (TMEM165/GDT1 family)